MLYKLNLQCEKKADFTKAAALIQAMPVEADIEIHLFNHSLYHNECIITWMSGIVTEIFDDDTMYVYNGGAAERHTDPICSRFLGCTNDIARNHFIDFLNFLIRK